MNFFTMNFYPKKIKQKDNELKDHFILLIKIIHFNDFCLNIIDSINFISHFYPWFIMMDFKKS